MTHTSKTTPVARGHVVRGEPLQQVGDWQLESLLGQGAWSWVYRARPLGCAHDGPADYVVKLPKSPHGDERLAVKLLQREAVVARHVSHPHLVAVLSAHVEQAPYYLVMPFLEGTSLRALLDTSVRPAVPHALWIARQTAEALQPLHTAGWLHADVKPDNIRVSPDGHVTLLDLGLARRLDDSECMAGGPLVGTLAYTAPEMISSALQKDARSDVYGLGVLLYEMLVGQLPFPARTPEEMVVAHLRETPRDPRSLAPHLSPRVVRLLRRMLAKQPLRRPAIGELITWLFDLEIDTFDEF